MESPFLMGGSPALYAMSTLSVTNPLIDALTVFPLAGGAVSVADHSS